MCGDGKKWAGDNAKKSAEGYGVFGDGVATVAEEQKC